MVILDLDGTLVDTAPDIADALSDVLAHLGAPSPAESRVREWIGYGARETLSRALRHADLQAMLLDAGTAQALAEEFARRYLERCGRRGTVYPGAREGLDALKAAGVRRALISNKEQALLQHVLQAFGLADAFDLVLGGDSLPARKPDPLPIRHCLTHFKCAPGHALFVGDSEIDIACARSAGIAIWTVPYGYSGVTGIAAAHPDRRIENLLALRDVRRPQARAPFDSAQDRLRQAQGERPLL